MLVKDTQPSMEVVKKKIRRFAKAVAIFTIFLFFLHLTFKSVKDLTVKDLTPFREFRREFSPIEAQSGQLKCDRSHKIYEICSINGTTLMDPTTSTFFSMAPAYSNSPGLVLKTKPYPRKKDKPAMSKVKDLTLTSVPPKLPCGVTHTSPALVISTGGYVGNFFHEFMDIWIPLFITVNSFFPEHDQDFILVVSDHRDWWAQKYADLIPQFTNHPIIKMDNETITHCFPSVIVGLVSHGYMIIDPILLPHPKTLLDFQDFIQNAYSKARDNAINTQSSHQSSSTRPRLVLVNRKKNVGRTILNLEEVKNTANELGFDVAVFEPNKNTSLAESFRLIHGSHAMLGVHGAALTHFLFLRPGSLLIQVVPIGTQWLSNTYFGNPARVLGLEYMEYKVRSEESSLSEEYEANHLVLRDPAAYCGGNWTKMRVYLKNQNVKLEMARFKRYMKDAYEKAKRFMDNES